MPLLMQGFPITSQNVDKFLSLDPLTLALIVIVVVVAMDFVKSWFKGRGQSANDAQQTAVIKFFTDEKSPMVESNKRNAENSQRVGDLLEKLVQRDDEHRAMLAQVDASAKEQTGVLRESVTVMTNLTNYQKLNNDQVADLGIKFDTLETSVTGFKTDTTASIATLKAEIKADIEAISGQLQGIKDILDKRDECLDMHEDLKAIRNILDKTATQPLPAVSNVSIDVPPSELKAAS